MYNILQFNRLYLLVYHFKTELHTDVNLVLVTNSCDEFHFDAYNVRHIVNISASRSPGCTNATRVSVDLASTDTLVTRMSKSARQG